MPQQKIAGLFINTTLNKLRQLVSRFPKEAGSVAVVSPARIHAQCLHWQKELPNVRPYYAVKSNPDPLLLQTLCNRFVNFDCASIREVNDVVSLVWPRDECGPTIVYAHPMKSDRDINIINKLNIKTTVVDSVEECKKLTANGWKGSALLRVAVSDSMSKMPFSVKFGATKEEVIKIAMWSKVPISGVSFHVGSGCEDPEQYRQAIEYAGGYVCDTLRKYGHYPKTIDIGGGFSAKQSEFQPAAAVIRDTISKATREYTYIAEPGRYYSQPAQDLFVKVIAKKPGPNGWRYVIDESLYGHFSCIPFDQQKPAWFRLPKSEAEPKRKLSQAILFGRTCDSLDVVARGEMEELEVGDWLYFPFMGAYTNATASEFNGFPKPAILEDTNSDLVPVATLESMIRAFHLNTRVTFSNALQPMRYDST